jgi:hypothetical protein
MPMNATELRAFIADRYNDDELRVLAFDLGIPFEDLGAPDSGKTARVQALIEWCNRHGRYAELETTARRARTSAMAGRPAPAMNEWGPAGIDRMVRHMDELREDVAELVTKVELQNQRLAMLEKHIDRIIEHPRSVSWQTWAVAVIGLAMAVALVYSVGQFLLGGH